MDRIAFFIPDMRVGGAEKTVLNLLKGMHAQGLMTDLIVISNDGIYNQELPDSVRVINLNKKRVAFALFSLANYLRKYKPRVLISNLSHCNVVALLASKMAGSITPLILVEHSILSGSGDQKNRLLFWLMKKLYPSADAIVAVAKKTAEDIEITLALKKGSVHSIYNPVSKDEVLIKSAVKPLHPWVGQKEISLLLAVGRLVPEKDFKTLLDAFSLVKERMHARLILFGDGVLLAELQQQAVALGIDKDVSLPGFTENPYAFMAAADLLVVSSVHEGFSMVLIEAMTCGCSVVSTDCPAGPAEILDNGKYGRLVTPGNPAVLAEAMIQTLQSPVDKRLLLDRASFFSVEKAVNEYLSLIDAVVGKKQDRKKHI